MYSIGLWYFRGHGTSQRKLYRAADNCLALHAPGKRHKAWNFEPYAEVYNAPVKATFSAILIIVSAVGWFSIHLSARERNGSTGDAPLDDSPPAYDRAVRGLLAGFPVENLNTFSRPRLNTRSNRNGSPKSLLQSAKVLFTSTFEE